MTGNNMTERWVDMQQRASGRTQTMAAAAAKTRPHQTGHPLYQLNSWLPRSWYFRVLYRRQLDMFQFLENNRASVLNQFLSAKLATRHHKYATQWSSVVSQSYRITFSVGERSFCWCRLWPFSIFKITMTLIAQRKGEKILKEKRNSIKGLLWYSSAAMFSSGWFHWDLNSNFG